MSREFEVMNRIDHFSVGAGDLAAGAKALSDKLGAMLPQGSKHDLMSTHNCVCQAGNESFLELIAMSCDMSLAKVGSYR